MPLHICDTDHSYGEWGSLARIRTPVPNVENNTADGVLKVIRAFYDEENVELIYTSFSGNEGSLTLNQVNPEPITNRSAVFVGRQKHVCALCNSTGVS